AYRQRPVEWVGIPASIISRGALPHHQGGARCLIGEWRFITGTVLSFCEQSRKRSRIESIAMLSGRSRNSTTRWPITWSVIREQRPCESPNRRVLLKPKSRLAQAARRSDLWLILNGRTILSDRSAGPMRPFFGQNVAKMVLTYPLAW